MKTIIRSITCILFFHLCFFEGYSGANTIFLGYIESVYPDGAINVLKNPALLAAQKEERSLGLIFNYRAYDQVDADFNFGILSNEETENKINKEMYGGASIAFSEKYKGNGFGIGISKSDDFLYQYKEEKTSFSGTTSTSEVFSVQTELKEKKINPRVNVGYGLKIGEDSFFGIKLTGEYSKTDTESESTQTILVGTVPVSLVNKNYNEIKTMVSGELSFGFYFTDKGSQLGFMVNSGKLSFVKSDIDYYNDELAQPEGKNSFSYYKQYNEGVSFVAGGYMRLLPFLGAALEGGYQLPANYNEKIYDDKTFEKIKTSVSNDSVILIKGGLDFILSPRLNFAVGGNLFFVKNSRSGKNNNYGESEYRGFNCMTGFDYYFLSGLRFMAGTQFGRYTGVGKSQIDDGSGSVIEIKLNNKQLSIDTYFGIMYSF